MPVAKPIVKWVGGKTKSLPLISKHMPERFERYHEPFGGGGALLFRMLNFRPDVECFFSDFNPHLIGLYETVRDDPEALIRRLQRHAEAHSRAHYEDLRRRFNAGALPPLDQAAAFLYMNKTGYNGLARYNQGGGFNTPWGKQKRFRPDVSGLRLASKALQDVRLAAQTWQEAVDQTAPGDLIYFDPPYESQPNKSGFVNYLSGGWTWADTEALAQAAIAQVTLGRHVMLSNVDTPEIRELFPTTLFDLVPVGESRSINCKGSKRGKVPCLLIVSK